MAIKERAFEYFTQKRLFEMPECEKQKACDEVFKKLKEIPNDYDNNKKQLEEIRGEKFVP